MDCITAACQKNLIDRTNGLRGFFSQCDCTESQYTLRQIRHGSIPDRFQRARLNSTSDINKRVPMPNYVQTMIDSPMASKLLGAVGLPEPITLERFDLSANSFIQGNILLGQAPGGSLVQAIGSCLKSAEAELFYPAGDAGRLGIEAGLQQAKAEARPYQLEIAKELRFKALVLDASGISNSRELRALYDFFHPVIRKLAPCARLLVIGRPVQPGDNPQLATARRALEGFSRCVGKEIGKKGATIQLLYVEEGAEDQLDAPLQFLLSPKSAYVSAQVLRVSSAKKPPVVDWKKPLAGKLALVTGASRGIGEKIAETLARDGATVVGLDIPALEPELHTLMQRIGGKVLAVDITADDAPQTIAKWLQSEVGGVDIVVHNAGITRDKTLGGMPAHFWDAVIDINLGAEERINAALLQEKVLDRGGRIICVSSVSGIAGNFGQSNYGTSKAGVIGMVQSMAPLLAKEDITINAVAPGFIATQMTEAMPLLVREVAKRINALGQAGKPQDVAEVVAFYANPLANGVNGNVVRVCGQSMLGA
jgi:3-oxoacyl-[acyl-carrier protein] reductase